MSSPRTSPGAVGRVRVGDRMKWKIGDRELPVEILGDRGPIGVGGRRLFRAKHVEAPDDEAFEVPEASLVR